MGRVWVGFFHTRTRPARQDPWPGPAPFRVPGFFPGPRPAPTGPHGPRGPRLEIGPNSWPNQKKKKKKSRFIFSFVQAQIYFCHSSLHIPNKKIKPNVRFLRESHLARKNQICLCLCLCLPSPFWALHSQQTQISTYIFALK